MRGRGTLKLLLIGLPLIAIISGGSAIASQSGSIILEQVSLLQLQVETAKQLDLFNFHATQSYVDCFCSVFPPQSPELASQCQSRAAVSSQQTLDFETSKISYKGETYAEVKSCEEAVTPLYQDSLELHAKSRRRMAIIQRDAPPNPYLEQETNVLSKLSHVIQTHLKPMVDLPSPWNILEPLTHDEIESALAAYFEEGDKILRDFLQSDTFDKNFGDLNLNLSTVESFLKGEPHKIMEEIEQSANQYSVADSWQSVNQLRETYFQFVAARRNQWINSHYKRLTSDVDNNPVLLYLPQAHPDEEDFLRALFEIEKNASDRYERSRIVLENLDKAMEQSPVEELGQVLHDYAFVMDHELAKTYLFDLATSTKKWKPAAFHSTFGELTRIRDRQIRNKTITEVAASFGVFALCYAPIPALKLGTASMLAVKSNACLMGVGAGVNTYFLTQSRAQQERFFSELMSTADGWNKLTKLNKVMEQNFETRLTLWFYLLEAAPAYGILKAL